MNERVLAAPVGMLRLWGVELAQPLRLNRPRAIALGTTLLLHAVVMAWLLALRFEVPTAPIPDPILVWQPARPAPPPPLATSAPALPPPPTAQISLSPRPAPVPDLAIPQIYDFEGTAKEVAEAFGRGPSRPTFGGPLESAPTRPKEEMPPSIWPKALPRVGTTVTTPEGETILWVSDYCYVSLQSRSLTMRDLHEGRQGVRTCILYQFGAKKKPRDDLFDAIKRPPPPQEPGCGTDGIGLSCGR